MSVPLQLEPARCGRKLSFDEVLSGKFPKGAIAERKEDDCRYLLHVNPAGDGKNYLTSRRQSVKDGRYVEKQDWCTVLRDFPFSPRLKGYVFDGGIVVPGKVSTDVVHAMRIGKGFHYALWDILYAGSVDCRAFPLQERWAMIDRIEEQLPFEYVRVGLRSRNPAALLRTIIAQKGEGIVLKDPTAPYGQGWTKVKKKQHFDVIVLGYNKPTSAIYASKGWIGQIVCGQIEQTAGVDQDQQVQMHKSAAYIKIGGTTYVCRYVANVKNMTDELRALISADPDKYIGRVLELSAQEQLRSGALRNPSVVGWRDDKNPTDCVLRIGDEA